MVLPFLKDWTIEIVNTNFWRRRVKVQFLGSAKRQTATKLVLDPKKNQILTDYIYVGKL